MTQKMNSIIYKNVLSLRDSEKLYLDYQSSDVFFVLNSNEQNCEKIPAHKCILSTTSAVFETIFYGSNAQTGDINIEDTTAEAFKEFLQFFYLNTVRLTVKNFPKVMNLIRKYEIDECINACNEVCELTLTLENMCWGYELAILFEHEDLMKFCEQNIRKNPNKIFRSSSFLNCRPNLLRCILQLDSLECDESMVFDGCLAWARSACIRKCIDETDMQNLRYQLGDIFYDIRFGDMAVEDFYDRYCFYKGLFTLDEFEDIISMIVLKNHQSDKFNSHSRTLKNPKLKVLDGTGIDVPDKISKIHLHRKSF